MGRENILVKGKESFFSFSELFIFILLFSSAVLPIYVFTTLSVAYIIYYLMTSGFSIPRDMARYLTIPLLLILIGISGSAGNLFYDVLKDGWYYLNPSIALCTGYLAMNRIKRVESLLKAFVIGGFLFSLYYLFSILTDVSFLRKASVQELHNEKGGGYLLSVVSLSIILIANHWGIELFQNRLKKLFVNFIRMINAAAVFLSFYRVLWLSFIILFLFGTGMVMRKKFKWLFILGIIIAVFQIFVVIAPRDVLNRATMIGKIANSIDEVFITDYYAKADIQQHWRGYESYMALQTYLEGNLLNMIAGYGFGKLVDLKIVMLLGSEKFRFIPILHNGYMYLLVKTGFIGLLLYLLYLYSFIRIGLNYANADDNYLNFSGHVIIALSVVLLATTFVAAGMFNKSLFLSLMVLLGCLLSYARIRKAELNRGGI